MFKLLSISCEPFTYPTDTLKQALLLPDRVACSSVTGQLQQKGVKEQQATRRVKFVSDGNKWNAFTFSTVY